MEEIIMTETADNRPGRPRKHQDMKARVKAWRQKQEGKRIDCYVDCRTSWQLKKLSSEWNCSIAGVIDRLVKEVSEKGGKYEEVLFPVTE
jgi:hypothetical protein